jgi:hypothetical protein
LFKFFDKEEASFLYERLVCEFEFTLLNHFNFIDWQEENKIITFLMHEMCSKIAFDVSHLDNNNYFNI